MNKEDIISSGLLELYALRLASPEDTIQVESWLVQYPEVKAELDAVELSLETYAGAFAVQPSSSLKEKLFTKIADSNLQAVTNTTLKNLGSNSARVYSIPTFYKILAAAVFLLLIGSVVLNYSYYGKYQAASNKLQVAQEKVQNNQQANLAMKNELNVIGDKSALPVVLNGTPHAPDALAKIYWVKTSGQVYVDPTNLPEVPSGKQYQLWAIVDGKPINAGMIATQNGIYHIQKMKAFGHAEAFAITLEKAGGSPTPTMDEMYVKAKI